MKLSSPRFKSGEEIPAQYSRDAGNRSPPLEILDVPHEAQSLALIVEDIDSPIGAVTHWVVWNIPPDTHGIEEGSLPASALCGMNGYGELGYFGPCPPVGRHRYRFRLLALDRQLTAVPPARKDHIEREMQGHVIAEAALTAHFQADAA
jgi:Raf kinase inhibitor-like YbhB/YbcL family protein